MSRSINNTRFAVQLDNYSSGDVYALEPLEGALFYDRDNDVLKYYDKDGNINNIIVEKFTGWGVYSDTEYTSGSPQTLTASTDNVLENNLGSKIETYLPSDISAFYSNGVNPRIVSNNVGDAFQVRINFTAKISNANGYATIKFDIGDGVTPVIISSNDLVFPKGNDVYHDFSATTAIYTLDTFVANGMRILVSPSHTMDVYAVSYLIERTHRAV